MTNNRDGDDNHSLSEDPLPGGPILTVDVGVDHFHVWVAQVRGYPGCIGDGQGKMEAAENAVTLLLHVLIMRLRRKTLMLRLVKQPDS